MGLFSVLFRISFAISLAIFTVVLIRTFSFKKPVPVLKCSEAEKDFIRASAEVLQRFSDSIKIPTVAYDVGKYDEKALLDMHQHIFKSFPVIHSSHLVEWEVVSNYSLLYKVKGSNEKLKPYIIVHHLDVVPPGNSTWKHPPFEGKILDGSVYGRGTLDDKGCVMALLEAVEYILKSGINPQRTFYFAFGHDEEVLGLYGAQDITALLKSRNVRMEFVLDEGLGVVSDSFPFIQEPIASVGVTEKGFLTLELRVSLPLSSHSSLPPSATTIGILARALHRLDTNPHPSRLGRGAEIAFLEHIAPYTPFPLKLVLSNLWLFGPFVSIASRYEPLLNALMRTTTALTIVEAGFKDNVLPKDARAIVNHRVHSSESMQDVIDFNKKVINDDRVQIEVLAAHDPHPVSSHDDDAVGFQAMALTIRQIFGDVIVAPGVMFANTDSKWYKSLTDNVYRFMPYNLNLHHWKLIHGENEHITIKAYEEAINFFYHFVTNMDKDISELLSKAKRDEL